MGFFGRDQGAKPTFEPTVPGGVAVDPRFRSAPSPSGDPHLRRGGTMIGPNTKINGELSGDEDIVVDGRVEGKVVLKKQLTVGPTGHVHADVVAKNVLIAGKLVGNVQAEEKVEIVATGSLEGNIRAAKIVIAEGAQFKGSVEMASGSSPRRDAADGAEARGERPPDRPEAQRPQGGKNRP